MAFPVDDIQLGPATFGNRKGTEGIVWHTTESLGWDRASALGTRLWQLSNPGSYNFIIYDGGLMLTVPYLEASGGLATGVAPYWQPDTWLKALLSPAAFADPNAYLLNVAFAGRTANMAKVPQNMIDTAAKLTRWIELTSWGADDLVMTGHEHWQTNRTDPGAGTIDRILKRYLELYPVSPVPTPVPTDLSGTPSGFGTPYPSYVHTKDQGYAWYRRTVRDLKAAGKIIL